MGKECNLIQLNFFFTTTDILIYFNLSAVIISRSDET